MLGDHILDQHIAAGGSSCYHIGTGFDLIGNDGIVGAVHHIHAVDLDDIGAGAADIRAHGVEEVCQIHNMRFLGNIFHDGDTLGLDRCQHHIDGSAHRYHIKVDVLAPELLAVHGHHAIVHRYIGAQGLEALDMLVNGAHTAEVAAAGQRYIGPSAAAQQRAQEIIGGTQGLCQLMGNHRFPDVGGIDLHSGFVQQAHLGAQIPQDIEKRGDIADIGDIFNDTDIPCQNSSRNDRHHRILCAADRDLALEDRASGNYILFHSHSLLYCIVLVFYYPSAVGCSFPAPAENHQNFLFGPD